MQQQQQQQQQQQLQEQPSQWEINDHNELYVIKAESMKKSYDGIVKKLQKERMKYMKHTQEETVQEKQVSDFIALFSTVKQEYMKRFQTKENLMKHQKKMRRRFELVQEQIKNEQSYQQQQR